MTTTSLTALAERCERAEKGSRELDAEIAATARIFPSHLPDWIDKNFPVWRGRPDGRCEVVHDNGMGGVHWEAPELTTSLDAAMSLVPEGWSVAGFGYVEDDKYKSGWWCELVSRPDQYVWVGLNDPMDYHQSDPGHLATPALALTAAALKALAALKESEG